VVSLLVRAFFRLFSVFSSITFLSSSVTGRAFKVQWVFTHSFAIVGNFRVFCATFPRLLDFTLCVAQCCGSGSAWICINLKGSIRIRIKLTSRIRIRIKVTSWIRIRINVMRIRNTGFAFTLVRPFHFFLRYLPDPQH
jgi:hypothetical protein